jgi:ribosomal protein S18 acetylase RimI-like enzyme
MRYALRRGTTADLDFILRVHVEAMRPHVERTFGAWDAAAQRARLLETTLPETHEIVELDGEPVGCRWVRPHLDSLELVRLWLLPHAQGKGLGTELVRELLVSAARLRVPARLRVLKVNPAQRLYRRLGFEDIATTETHVQMRHTLQPRGLERIVSGGQTGADRAALDVALELGLATGGWIPRGRRAEDGVVPARYPGLVETDSDDYAQRTRWNVRDSDATVVLGFGPAEGGSALTLEVARAQGKPVLELDLEQLAPPEAAIQLRVWLTETRPRTLNVAGPRASKEPRIAQATAGVLRAALAELPRS